MTARILNLACRHLAAHLGIAEYTTAQLSHDSGINHSVILRAAMFEVPGEGTEAQAGSATGEDLQGERKKGERHREKTGPTIQTVRKLATTLKVELDPSLEDSFYNAFGYASPRQLAAAQTYVEQKETAAQGEGDNT